MNTGEGGKKPVVLSDVDGLEIAIAMEATFHSPLQGARGNVYFLGCGGVVFGCSCVLGVQAKNTASQTVVCKSAPVVVQLQ